MTTLHSTTQDLIESHQGIVYSLASKTKRSVPFRIDLDDLIAYGQVGLAEAASNFDPEKSTQFSTFAYYRVRGAIFDGLSKMCWTSRAQLRRHRYEQMANETLVAEAEESSANDNTTLEQDAQWFQRITQKLAVVYLASECQTADRDEDDNQQAIVDLRLSTSSIVARREINGKLGELVDELPRAERDLIRRVYFEGETLQEAADRLGMSKSWASRVHAKTLEKLARSLRRIGVADT